MQWIERKDPQIFHGRCFELAATMQRPGKPKCGRACIRLEFCRSSPDHGSLIEPTLAQQQIAETAESVEPIGIARERRAINPLCRGNPAGAVVPLRYDELPSPK